MENRRNSFAYEDLLACGRGELFGPGNAQLPLPPMLMFDRITEISETGGIRLRPWSIRWADPDELDLMAAQSGLQVAERWADYDRSAFDDTSDRHVTVYTSPGKPGQVRT